MHRKLCPDRLNNASKRVDGSLAEGRFAARFGGYERPGHRSQRDARGFQAGSRHAATHGSGPSPEGLARFPYQGLRDVEALVRDCRRSINRIEEAISGLEVPPAAHSYGGRRHGAPV